MRKLTSMSMTPTPSNSLATCALACTVEIVGLFVFADPGGSLVPGRLLVTLTAAAVPTLALALPLPADTADVTLPLAEIAGARLESIKQSTKISCNLGRVSCNSVDLLHLIPQLFMNEVYTTGRATAMPAKDLAPITVISASVGMISEGRNPDPTTLICDALSMGEHEGVISVGVNECTRILS